MPDGSFININGDGVQSLEVLFLLTLISLLPSILIMVSSFTRITIVLSFVRNAIGVQQSPPNMVIIGISLFLTLFIMNPVITEINETAYKPYTEQEITQSVAIDRGSIPLKRFMLKQTETKSLNMFLRLSDTDEMPENVEDLPMTIVIPAFITSELNRAFIMGFLILIPFLLIDIIVASTLMSMGMIMLPPAMISLPFKILLFIVMGGWDIIFNTIISSFR